MKVDAGPPLALVQGRSAKNGDALLVELSRLAEFEGAYYRKVPVRRPTPDEIQKHAGDPIALLATLTGLPAAFFAQLSLTDGARFSFALEALGPTPNNAVLSAFAARGAAPEKSK